MSLDRLQAMSQRRARLEAEAARLRGEEARARRATDTRRKIVVGAAVLAAAKSDERTRAWLAGVLARVVTAERDRRLLADPLP